MSQKRVRVNFRYHTIPYIEISSKKQCLKKKSAPPSYDDSASASGLTCSQTQISAAEVVENDDERDVTWGDDVQFSYFGDDGNSLGQGCSYYERQRKSAEHWSEIRYQLQHVLVESSTPVPLSDAGCIVDLCDKVAMASCVDCGSEAYFCEDHVELFHSKVNIFHRPHVWENGLLRPYSFKQQPSFPVWNHTCATPKAYSKEVVCVDDKGFQHRVCVGFCSCEPEAVTLVRYNMWPATATNPTFAFHQDLLLWLESFVLEGCIGVDAFCRALDYKRGKSISLQIRNVYPVIIEGFEEFRFSRHQLYSLKFLSPELDHTTICPACPKEEGETKIISMDGIFGLCRKMSSGISVRPPLFSGVFFEDQECVDTFVSNYDSLHLLQSKGCHQFLAGDALRSKGRYSALDETAVFGSICRHQVPQRFFNMKHGERLAYPVYLLEKLKEGNQSLLLLYDIACLLEAHLKNHGRTDLLHQTSFGVPIFHVYAHGAFCQLTYSPRVLNGCGLTDGEATERLWSYLRRFAKTTKEMRPSHRIDVLTSALMHYTSKVRLNIGVLLVKRLKHAQDVGHCAKNELAALIESSNGTLTEMSIPELEEKQAIILSKNTVTSSYGQRHKSFQNVLYLARERKFLLSTKARYADGQTISTRLANKITSTTSSLKRAISRFNSMTPDTMEGTVYALPRQLQWEHVVNLAELSSLEVSSLGNTSSTLKVPIDVWIKLIRESNMIKRASEEEKMVRKEFITVETSLKEEHALILQHIASIQSASCLSLSRYEHGCVHLLNKRLLLCESSLLTFSKNVSAYHTVQLPKLRHLLSTDVCYEEELYDDELCQTSDRSDHSDSDDSDSTISNSDF